MKIWDSVYISVLFIYLFIWRESKRTLFTRELRFKNLVSKYQKEKFQYFKWKGKEKEKRKFVCLFFTDMYERKRVRSDPQISRESYISVII